MFSIKNALWNYLYSCIQGEPWLGSSLYVSQLFTVIGILVQNALQQRLAYRTVLLYFVRDCI